MIYLDESYIIKCYLDEPGTSEVLALVQGNLGRSSSRTGEASCVRQTSTSTRADHFGQEGEIGLAAN